MLDCSGVSGKPGSSREDLWQLFETHVFLKPNTKVGLDYSGLWRMTLSVPINPRFFWGTHGSCVFTLFFLNFQN